METEHPEHIGEYDIVGVIGKGAMGKVYKGIHPSLGTVVAIKVLPSEFLQDTERVERFNREAQAVALLDHPNVVRIIEKKEEDDQVYFVMEFVPGASLEAILRQRRLSLHEAFRVFKNVCRGLEAAHQKSIVHRDLSPKNILVSEDLAVAKIADFGISRVEAISRQQGTLSTTEFSLGSLHYIAPEQARNMVSADHRADIYSLGVLLYEMLTGRVPVGQFSLPSQLNSEVPPEVDPIVLRCLEVDPQRRYPTVGRLMKEVGQLEDQLRLGLVHEVRGLGSQTSRIFLKSTAGRAVRITLIAAGVLALVATAFLALRGGDPGPPAAGTEPTETGEQGPDLVVPDDGLAVEAPDSMAAPLLDETAGAQPSPAATSGQALPATGAPAAEAGKAPVTAPAATATKPTPPPQRAPDLSQDLLVAQKKFDAGLFDEALADIEKFLADHPTARLAPDAYLLLGRIHEGRRDTDKARAAYIELRSRFAESAAAVESTYRSAKLLIAEGGREQTRDARALLGKLAQEHSDSQWAAQALIDKAALEVAEKLTVQDAALKAQVPAALVSYRDLVANHPDHPGVEDALWNLAEMYSDLKKFELAAAAYQKLGEQFPNTRYDAWWSAGQVYDRRLDDNDRAIAAYRNVPPSSRNHGDAQRRISKLTR